jgi:hypothetical protein
MFVFIVLVECRRFNETAVSDGSIVHLGGDRSVAMENVGEKQTKENRSGKTALELFSLTLFSHFLSLEGPQFFVVTSITEIELTKHKETHSVFTVKR